MTEPTLFSGGPAGSVTGPGPQPTPWAVWPGYLSYGGAIVVGTPTGGQKGIGSINVQDIFINGNPFDFGTVLALAGGTLTGPLILNANPSNVLGAATKQYVDSAVASAGSGTFLPLAGGTLTGFLTLNANPTVALQAATKGYVDSAIAGVGGGVYLPLAGGTMTGQITLPANPTVALQATTKQYVDGRTPITVDAPSDSNYYTRQNGAWVVTPTYAGVYVPIAGGVTMTGLLTLSGAPSAANGAATKAYVDGRTPITVDAPNDGQYYTRHNLAWAVAPGGLTDAPSDGSTYGRLNGAWSNVIDAGTF